MTYKEAHKFLEVKQREMTQNRHLYNETAIAVNGKAIEAIEKQIPKKPIKQEITLYLSKATDVLCPMCNKSVCTWITLDSHSKIRPFCPNCGQALDWGNEK